MPTKAQYDENARKALSGLFPNMSDEAFEALVFLVVDALMSLDAIADNIDHIDR